MRVVIVFNHPYEKSYCNAILGAVTTGLQKGKHQVDLIHLDNDNFNPAMSKEDLKAFVDHTPIDPQVIDYSNRLKNADHLIFIFPIWWDLMPAMTKGFIDRVLSPGIVYDHHPRGFGLIPCLAFHKPLTCLWGCFSVRHFWFSGLWNLCLQYKTRIIWTIGAGIW